MSYKNIKRLQTIAFNLRQSMPSNHKDFYYVHQAPRKIDEVIDAAIELSRWTTLAEYIESQPGSHQDRVKLSEIQGKLKLYQKRVDAADELKHQLADIAVNFQIEQAAKNAGATNPKIVSMIFENEITHTIDSTGEIKVDVGGRSVQSAVESLVDSEDTKFLFDRSAAPCKTNDGEARGKYSGPNPWCKGPGFNLTKQGQIYRDNPALAKRLKQESVE